MLRKAANVTLSLALLSLTAAVASAEIPDLDLSSAVVATENAVLYVMPDGSGDPFTMGHLADGTVVDATITLTLVNFQNDPLPGYPAEDLWLETSGGGLNFPTDGTIADAPTDANGETQWVDPLMAGGCTIGEDVLVMVAGQSLTQPGLPLEFVSSDINGDLIVNLADLSLFAGAYTVAYDPCGDLYFDGVINLTDLSRFAAAYL